MGVSAPGGTGGFEPTRRSYRHEFFGRVGTGTADTGATGAGIIRFRLRVFNRHSTNRVATGKREWKFDGVRSIHVFKRRHSTSIIAAGRCGRSLPCATRVVGRPHCSISLLDQLVRRVPLLADAPPADTALLEVCLSLRHGLGLCRGVVRCTAVGHHRGWNRDGGRPGDRRSQESLTPGARSFS